MPRIPFGRVALGLIWIASWVVAGEERRIENQLAVQTALDASLEHVRRGNFRDAVLTLEKHLAHIDGNRRYLLTLRDAYIGYIGQLQQAGKSSEARIYQDRLAILSPPKSAEQKTPQRPAPGERRSETPTSPIRPAATEKPAAVPAQLVHEPRRLALGKSNLDEPAGDPFSEANRAPPEGQNDLLVRADRAFAAKNYPEAARLYEEAEAAMPGCTNVAAERVAYCKLYRVARMISGEGIPIGDDLEHEIEEAVRLCPTKMKAFADQLREKMREAVADVSIRHTPRQGQGWALAETANFRIFHATTNEAAEKACRLAEATRAAMARKWLGSSLPTWTPRCDIYLHPTIKGYLVANGREGSPGHSSITLVEGRVTLRRIDLRMDDPNLFLSTLQHEATHVVLAGNVGNHHGPRWADEGIAVLSESRDRVQMHVRHLPQYRRDGKLFRVETLLKLPDYPDAARVPSFYAQSVSLCDFLARRKSPPTLTAFLRDGLQRGYEEALRTHYGIDSFAQLEEEWLKHAFGGNQAAYTPQLSR
ncbi:MAG: hypothetical protein SNJ75_01720 [Gemmataceae bacterium]